MVKKRAQARRWVDLHLRKRRARLISKLDKEANTLTVGQLTVPVLRRIISDNHKIYRSLRVMSDQYKKNYLKNPTTETNVDWITQKQLLVECREEIKQLQQLLKEAQKKRVV